MKTIFIYGSKSDAAAYDQLAVNIFKGHPEQFRCRMHAAQAP